MLPSLEKYATQTALALLAAIAPIYALLITTGALIVADLILGVWASRKRGIAITSSRLRDTVSKMLIYHSVLVLGFFVEKHMLHGLVPITKIAASCIGLVELKSVYENASLILGKPIFAEILFRLGSKSKK